MYICLTGHMTTHVYMLWHFTIQKCDSNIICYINISHQVLLTPSPELTDYHYMLQSVCVCGNEVKLLFWKFSIRPDISFLTSHIQLCALMQVGYFWENGGFNCTFVKINNSMCVVQCMQQREHKETGGSFRLSSFC